MTLPNIDPVRLAVLGAAGAVAGALLSRSPVSGAVIGAAVGAGAEVAYDLVMGQDAADTGSAQLAELGFNPLADVL